MGELVTTTGDTLDGFLGDVNRAKQSITAAINSDDLLRAAFAQADAKMVLLSSMDEKISAYLLRFCDQKLQMVECVNNPSDEEKIRVVALAILNGFVPGDDDFSVFGGKGGAKLYTKESGYRKLFARLNGCRAVDVTPGHPVFANLGTTDKKVWRVEGVASCEINGEIHKIECLGKFAIGLPGRETDNVAGIAAKARRRLLKLLWEKVSPMRFHDGDDDEEPASVTVVDPTAITEATVKTQEPPKEISEYEMHVKSWHATWSAETKKVNDTNHPVLVCARQMRDATSETQLKLAADEADRLRKSELVSQRQFESLERYFEFLISKPQEVPA